MKKTIGGLILTGLLTLGVATSGAHAAVNYDATTGSGFVGKGDIAQKFGWNNAQTLANASGVTFTYVTKTEYDVTVEWDTVTGGKEPKTIHHTNYHTTDVNSATAVDPSIRKNKTDNITGFNLIGFGASTDEGIVPVVGQTWNDSEQQPHPITNVEITSSTTMLYANFGGVSVELPNTPVDLVVTQ